MIIDLILLYKVSQLLNKKLPINHSEEYYTSSLTFISNIAIKNLTSDCMNNTLLDSFLLQMQHHNAYIKKQYAIFARPGVKLVDKCEAIADLQQDKQKPTIFFTQLLCLLWKENLFTIFFTLLQQLFYRHGSLLVLNNYTIGADGCWHYSFSVLPLLSKAMLYSKDLFLPSLYWQ